MKGRPKPSLPADILLRRSENDMRVVVLVQGRMQGAPRWAYARMTPSRYLEFQKVHGKEAYDLAEYAEAILEHGEGDSPPESVRQKMDREYGTNHALEDELLALMEQAARTIEENS